MYTNIMHGLRVLTISESVDNLDLGEYVLNGRLDLLLHIPAGVTIGSTYEVVGPGPYDTEPRPAISSSEAITGGSVTIVNYGVIQGHNGAKGWSTFRIPPAATVHATAGGDGADAVRLPLHIIVKNFGSIFAGGGGGGGGGIYDAISPTSAGIAGGYAGSFFVPDGAQYGQELGLEANGLYGGDCVGPGANGTAGDGSDGKAGGLSGYGINSQGNVVDIISGAAGILGGTA
jgi:hypothetical protein